MRFRRPVLGTCLLIGCAAFAAAQNVEKKSDAKTRYLPDVVYGKGGDKDLLLDLALPDGAGPFPCIVCVHGGGWRGGSRHDFKTLIQQLASQGFVAATVTYRLSPQHQFPCQIEDCKAAVRFLRGQADKYQIDKKRFGAVGASAGGHLVCLLGAADDKAGLEGKGGSPKESSRVQAVVSYFGPTDFVTKTWTKEVEDFFLVPFIGGPFEEKMDLYRKCSPLEYCTPDDPPFLFFHGDKDTLVGIEHSQKMSKKLREIGVSAELVTMEGENHGWGGDKLKKSMEQTVRFFNDKLRK